MKYSSRLYNFFLLTTWEVSLSVIYGRGVSTDIIHCFSGLIHALFRISVFFCSLFSTDL